MLAVEDIKKLIPQRYPFLMLDRVTEVREGEFLRAYKNISINEKCFEGHFPGEPVFPGAYIAEAAAQAACVLIKVSIKDLAAKHFYITNAKIRFFKVVVPGDRLDVFIRAVKMVRMGGIFEFESGVGGETVAKGEMTFACK